LTNATSNTFNVIGAASKLAFTVQPGNTTVGAAFNPVVQVTVQDASGNKVDSATNNITIAATGTTLGGTTNNVAAVAGVATFNGVTVGTTPATGCTLNATATGLTGATSNTFNVVAQAPPGKATFLSPGNGATGVSITTSLNWSAGSGTTTGYDVWFNGAKVSSNQSGTSYNPGTLAYETTYQWHIDSIGPGGTTTGDTWTFTTRSEPVTCFLADTKILTSDSREINIQDIKKGDDILAFTSDGSIVTTKIRDVLVSKASEYYEITTDQATVKVTAEHPFCTSAGVFKPVKELAVGDTILVLKDTILVEELVRQKRLIKEEVIVYNLRTDYPHTFFANKIAVHNKPIPE
jgi:hypothetical protein